MLEAVVNYGPIKRRQDYRVLNEGKDWYLVAVRGKSVYVPKWVFED
jgi:hypothetical protein